jgi:hypothetical protein
MSEFSFGALVDIALFASLRLPPRLSVVDTLVGTTIVTSGHLKLALMLSLLTPHDVAVSCLFTILGLYLYHTDRHILVGFVTT